MYCETVNFVGENGGERAPRTMENGRGEIALSSSWTFSYRRTCGEDDDDRPQQLRRWRRHDRNATVRTLFDVSTAGEFVRAYGAAKLPSALPAGAGYYFFRRGVRPAREHGPNGGGSWNMLLDDRPGDNGNELNLVWSELLYMLVTDGFRGLAGHVRGVACTVKRGDGTHRLAVCTVPVTPANREHVAAVGRLLRAVVLDVYRRVKSVEYAPHDKSPDDGPAERAP